jgi:alkylhydroperoxidase/carboxymuconolactone decarboxylase family protein YurZ
MRPGRPRVSSPVVSPQEELLRRLALNDERSVATVLTGGPGFGSETPLTPKVDALVRLGALLSVGAATTSLRRTVELALSLGATEEEIVAVLVAIGPAVGLARLVTTAPRLAVAIGYDLDDE